MKTRTRRRGLRVILTIILCLLLAAGCACGGLWYVYTTTDETAVPRPQATVGGAALSMESLSWNTPVFGGQLYKPYAETAQLAAQPIVTLKAPSFLLETPQDATAQLTITNAAGTVMPCTQTPEGFSVTALENGVYTLQLVLDYPKAEGKAYGSFVYSGSVEVLRPLEISFAQGTVPQGGVYTVVVYSPGDGAVPVLSHPLGTTTFAKKGDTYVAAVGIGYRTEPGRYPVTVTCGEVSQTETLEVVKGTFSRQDMTISGTIAGATNTAAANKEWRDAIWPLYDTFDDTVYWDTFVLPTAKRILNTEYGLFRYTNGGATPERHAGVDLDGDTGDPVSATASGRVVLARFLTLTGNTVVIEHGGGVKSYYFHMDSLACIEGAMVTAGAPIGTVGTTGYSTGPHLHFEVKAGNQSIDPLALVDGTSGLFFPGNPAHASAP